MNNKIDINGLVKTVNAKLINGYSIAAIEREFKWGKDTLRKQLNRAGYKFDRHDRQFHFHEESDGKSERTHVVTQNITRPEAGKTVDPSNEHNENTSITQIKNSNNNTDITHNITQINSKDKDIEAPENPINKFTDDDIKILFNLIEDYKLKEKTNTLNYEKNNDDIITRSVRSYKTVLNDFSDFCKANNLPQKDAIADALMLYMKTQS